MMSRVETPSASALKLAMIRCRSTDGATARTSSTPGVEDVRAVAPAVLRHRIIPNFNAEADGISTLDIIAKLLETTPGPDGKRA